MTGDCTKPLNALMVFAVFLFGCGSPPGSRTLTELDKTQTDVDEPPAGILKYGPVLVEKLNRKEVEKVPLGLTIDALGNASPNCEWTVGSNFAISTPADEGGQYIFVFFDADRRKLGENGFVDRLTGVVHWFPPSDERKALWILPANRRGQGAEGW